MSPRPIVFVSERYPALPETFTRREVRDLVAGGFDVTVVSLHPARSFDPPPEAGVDPPIVVLPSPLSLEVVGALASAALARPVETARLLAAALLPHTTPFSLAYQARAPLHVAWGAWLSRQLPQRAHVHAQFLGAASTVAWAAARLAGATFSFRAHADWGLPLARPKLRDASFVLSISEHERRRLLHHAPGVPGDRIVVQRLGVEPRQPGPRESRFGGPARIVAVGSLGPTKGHDVLVRACGVLRDRGVDATCTIVGDGSGRVALERLVAELRLGDRVTLAGALPHAAALELVDRADLAVLACRVTSRGDADGIPVALMESMAAGVATVSTRVGAIPELLEDGVSGRLVPPERPDLLAAAIADLLEDDALRARLARAGAERVRSLHDAASARAELLATFRARLA